MNDFITHGVKSITQLTIHGITDIRSGGQSTITGVVHGDAPFGQSFAFLPNDAIAYFQNLRAIGWHVETQNTQKGNQWTFTATYPADLVLDPYQTWIPAPIWEVEPHEVEPPLLICSELPFIANLTQKTKDIISLAVLHKSDAILSSIKDDKQLYNAIIAYSLMVTGVKGFPRITKSLKRTLIAGIQYNPQWLDTYDEMIMSKNFLAATYSIPLVTQALMPTGDTQVQTDSSGMTSFKGWRQMPVASLSIPPNKAQYQQIWMYDRWSVQPNGLYKIVG